MWFQNVLEHVLKLKEVLCCLEPEAMRVFQISTSCILWLQPAVSLGHFADDSISHSLSPNSLHVHSFVEESNIWILVMVSMCAILFPVNTLLESGIGKVFPHDECCMHFCTLYVKRNLAELKNKNKKGGDKKGNQKSGASSVQGITG